MSNGGSLGLLSTECTFSFGEVDIGKDFLSSAYNRVSIIATFILKKKIITPDELDLYCWN